MQILQISVPTLGRREEQAHRLVCKVIEFSSAAMKDFKCQIYTFRRSGDETVVKYPVAGIISGSKDSWKDSEEYGELQREITTAVDLAQGWNGTATCWYHSLFHLADCSNKGHLVFSLITCHPLSMPPCPWCSLTTFLTAYLVALALTPTISLQFISELCDHHSIQTLFLRVH